jgi:hypothetical protein
MPAVDEPAANIERVHAELWRRFVDKHDVLLDFTELNGTVSVPTPKECRDGKPNALGWWTPIENGAMFNGLFLDGAVNRALATGADKDKDKARRLAEGLLRLASCSTSKGFVGRGFADDGKTTWPMGSNDQTGPWFYGREWLANAGRTAVSFSRNVCGLQLERSAPSVVCLQSDAPDHRRRDVGRSLSHRAARRSEKRGWHVPPTSM